MMRSRRVAAAFPPLIVIICTLFALSGCGGQQASSSGSKPYAGTTIRVMLSNHPWADAIKPLLPQFQQQTGIQVKVESYGETQLAQKLTVEFASGSSTIDVFMQRPLQDARLYVKNGWNVDLNTYVKDSNKTPASWDYKDIVPSALATVTINNTLSSIPIVSEHQVLYYRKDLLQQAGLSVPKTLTELQQAAAKLNNPGKQQYGFVARGQQAQAVTQFSGFLYNLGGDWFDPQTHKATLNTPAALAAFKLYGDLLRNYGPPGVLNMSWPQAVAVFGQGKAALYTDADSIYENLLDPTKSQVADKTGVAPFPSGPAGSTPYSVCSWGLAISSNAPNKDAAWEFIKWATSKEITLKTQGNGAVPSARTSVYTMKGGVDKFPKDWLAAAQAETGGKQYDRPVVVQVGQARDIIGTVIVAAIEGKDINASAQQANTQFQELLDKEFK